MYHTLLISTKYPTNNTHRGGPIDSANITLTPPVTIPPFQIVHKKRIDSATKLYAVARRIDLQV